MKLNCEAYPESANVYDSIGEVYMELGDTALAIKNYEQSLKLNPANTMRRKCYRSFGRRSRMYDL